MLLGMKNSLILCHNGPAMAVSRNGTQVRDAEAVRRLCGVRTWGSGALVPALRPWSLFPLLTPATFSVSLGSPVTLPDTSAACSDDFSNCLQSPNWLIWGLGPGGWGQAQGQTYARGDHHPPRELSPPSSAPSPPRRRARRGLPWNSPSALGPLKATPKCKRSELSP